jgi:CBS domain containing-hemolysin-like protein
VGISLILILFSYALLKGSELAYFSFSAKDSEELGALQDKKSKRVSKHLADPDNIAGTMLLFETMHQIAVLFLISELFFIFFSPSEYLFFWAIVILFSTSVVLRYTGNIFSGYLTENNRHIRFSLRFSKCFSVLLFLAQPFNMILSAFTKVLSETREERDAQSMEEYTEVIDATDSEEVEEKKLLKKIAGLNTTSVSQIMKPRVEIVSLDMEMNSQEVIEKAIESGFSRLPVYVGSPDNVKGFLYIKDLVGYLREKTTDFNWHKHIREAYFVPGSKKINDLLEEFRQKKMHLALVADEYGGTDGLVTLEDILEEIVGEISDETDTNE